MSQRPRPFWIAIALAGCALGFVPPARADQASAQACAQSLPPEAATIYKDAAPETQADTDLRSLLKTRVKALVLDGRVQRATARSSAMAAYRCLKDLK